MGRVTSPRFSADRMPSRSRSAIKKYILANNKTVASNLNVFDSQVNKAIRNGVEKGDFAQPKGKPLVPRLLLCICIVAPRIEVPIIVMFPAAHFAPTIQIHTV